MTPDLQLAKAVVEAVMARIEQDRSINSSNLTEAVLGKLLFADAVEKAARQLGAARQPPEGSHVSPVVLASARQLLHHLKNWVVASQAQGIPWEVTSAGVKLERALKAEGLL